MTLVVDPARYAAAPRFPVYVDSVVKHADLWRGVYRTALVPLAMIELARDVPPGVRLLALSEDWCGDAVSTLPVIARLAEAASIDLRVLGRDANPDLMDAHLSAGSRSIPVVMVLDGECRERAWWGPRPAVVQRWMRDEGLMLPKEDRNRRKRAWYARDRGRTTVAELVEALARAARRVQGNGQNGQRATGNG